MHERLKNLWPLFPFRKLFTDPRILTKHITFVVNMFQYMIDVYKTRLVYVINDGLSSFDYNRCLGHRRPTFSIKGTCS